MLFIAGPLIYFRLVTVPWLLFPALWALSFYALAILLIDPDFDRRTLWNRRAMSAAMPRVLIAFAALGSVLLLGIAAYDRFGAAAEPLLFSLPRRNPTLWAIIMTFYPLVSVYPQEIVWRTFVFHRYARLFPSPTTMIAASAVAFGFAHVVFHNVIAMTLCTVGGCLFALTYARSRSTLAAWIEHALYGCLVFTAGIGSYFYSGSVHTP